jgi:hypothetical protein
MHVVQEDPAATDARLKAVCRESTVEQMPGVYAYRQFEASEFASQGDAEALALVRDGARWSQLALVDDAGGETLAVFSIHFPAAIDNSGFVGWLASLLKARHGTGVIVVCGLNDARGGIFDYWGVPEGVADRVWETLRELFVGPPSWRDMDGLAYQEEIRSEWEDRFPTKP